MKSPNFRLFLTASLLVLSGPAALAAEGGPPAELTKGVCTISDDGCANVQVLLNGVDVQNFFYTSSCGNPIIPAKRTAALAAADASGKKLADGGVCVYLGSLNN